MNDLIVYLNGEYLPIGEAKVSVLDRGFVFGDGVYEVIPVYQQQPFRLAQHLVRLQNSLDAVRIKNPCTSQQWEEILRRLITQNGFDDQSIYLQVTRGVAKRDHFFPKDVQPTVFVMTNPLPAVDRESALRGIAAITLDDIRWQYCNIKAITLLPNVLLRQQAADNGAYEAILVRDGNVTEGAASNIFIVKNGTIKTPPKSPLLLPGITRDLVVELAQAHGIACQETPFSQSELFNADEIWLTSSTREIFPVVTLNGNPVHSGKAGPLTTQMYDIYQAYKTQLKQGKAL
jgi:D-alanine transaminase